ncbi:hypothetical protein N7537_001234 [Penicillium hordei]|uniref:Four-carbon acid sugar kinase nucleotide binding domain-containing protein n=1 Tax=Penicillium hordei TaxID=40994 RepID=A0AAD6EGA3_9EURO|nr:uncharacterized protein N7537_001234 [Penicillium hordei]KAJ5616120.1 hypothetical protein N7537_001234 [Penicillium hordei]
MLRDSPVLQDIVAYTSGDLQNGKDVLVMTSRDLVTLDSVNSWASETSKEITNLDINNLVANTLVHIVRNLSVCPRYLPAKGGVTSSDVATAGIATKRAKVLGQAARLGFPFDGVKARKILRVKIKEDGRSNGVSCH